MKTIYFDCFAGASGDMILGSLIDAGLDQNELSSMLQEIGLNNFSLDAEKEVRNGITGTNLHVNIDEEKIHRHLPDILKMLDSPALSDKVKELVTAVFTRIAAAESRIHNIPVNKVHFHEVGALDSIIDIVGSVWGLERLGIQKCYSTVMSIGTGTVDCAHGRFPVPAPATLELLKDFPVVTKETGAEICTPTGAALITTLAEHSKAMPQLKISNIGYGIGDRDTLPFPNLFRAIIGESETRYETDQVKYIETDIDDMNPEFMPHIQEKLFAAGALDVTTATVQMKKGRHGTRLSVIANQNELDAIVSIVFAETTTIGLRVQDVSRIKLPRKIVNIETEWGTIPAKEVIREGKKEIIPEYEECKKIAREHKTPIKNIYDTIKNL